jgi:hypothetical protein
MRLAKLLHGHPAAFLLRNLLLPIIDSRCCSLLRSGLFHLDHYAASHRDSQQGFTRRLPKFCYSAKPAAKTNPPLFARARLASSESKHWQRCALDPQLRCCLQNRTAAFSITNFLLFRVAGYRTKTPLSIASIIRKETNQTPALIKQKIAMPTRSAGQFIFSNLLQALSRSGKTNSRSSFSMLTLITKRFLSPSRQLFDSFAELESEVVQIARCNGLSSSSVTTG